MSIYLKTSAEDEPTFLCSIKGWGNVGRYIDDLSESFSCLHHLRAYGWEQDIPNLLAEIDKATDTCHDEDVKSILLSLTELAEGEDVVVITDGMGP